MSRQTAGKKAASRKASTKKTSAKRGGKPKSARKGAPSGRSSEARQLSQAITQLSTITARLAKVAESIIGSVGDPAPPTALRGVERSAESCIDLLIATQIVQNAAKGPHDIDKKLLDIGLISEPQRRLFQEDVFEGVSDVGCKINRGDIPNGADTTLREVRTAIRAAAH